MSVCFSCNEELASRINAENTVELFLLIEVHPNQLHFKSTFLFFPSLALLPLYDSYAP